MAATVTQLRTNFPEFASVTAFPEDQVAYWLTVASLMLTPAAARWGNVFDLGQQLFACHNLAIERGAQKSGAAGAVPGINAGPISAKTVDKVSVSYDTQAGIEVDGGHWNLTIYGTRFLRLARMIGSGGIQL